MPEDRGTETLTGATEVLQAVRLWSRGAERMFGWGQNEVLGKPLPTVPPDLEMEFRWLLASQFSGESFEDVETIRMRKDGSQFPVALWTTPYSTPPERWLRS